MRLAKSFFLTGLVILKSFLLRLRSYSVEYLITVLPDVVVVVGFIWVPTGRDCCPWDPDELLLRRWGTRFKVLVKVVLFAEFTVGNKE